MSIENIGLFFVGFQTVFCVAYIVCCLVLATIEKYSEMRKLAWPFFEYMFVQGKCIADRDTEYTEHHGREFLLRAAIHNAKVTNRLRRLLVLLGILYLELLTWVVL